jgi:hypothetical protein
MPTTLQTAAVAVAVVVMATGAVDVRSAQRGEVFITSQPVIQDALKRIARGSPSWRQAIEAVAAQGRSAVILTPDEVLVRQPAGGRAAFDASEIAEVAPVADRDGLVSAVLVVVNVDRLRELHDRRGSLTGEFEADLDRVLAHEVYGHAVPYLTAGHLSARCPDPVPGQPPTEACAIRRENAIRAELRLGRRTDSAYGSLSLARSLRD